jgi:hypothetical protein
VSPERVALFLMCDVCNERRRFLAADETEARKDAQESKWLVVVGGFVGCPACTAAAVATNHVSVSL